MYAIAAVIIIGALIALSTVLSASENPNGGNVTSSWS